MGLIHVAVTLRRFEGPDEAYTADFLVDTGATDSMAPAAELQRIGIESAGRVLFGSDNVEPLLGVTALESVGITIDPANGTLRRLPAISLKRYRPSTALWPAVSVVSGITPPGSPSRIQSISSR